MIYRSSISLDLRRYLELPRRRSTSYRWISRAFWIPALSSTFVSLQVFPRFRRSAGSSLDLPRILPRDLPRLRFPASFTLEFSCVLLRYSIGAIACLERSSLECLYTFIWI